MNAHARRLLVSASLFISLLTPALAFAQTPQPPSPSCTLTATPSSIIVGGSVTLKWSSTNATSGTISHIGNVELNGSLNILPSSAQQTTFTGTFVGPGGTATCSTIVTVSSGAGGAGIGGGAGTGAYGTSGGNADPTLNYETPQNTYTPSSYTVNPANFQTQPSNNTFSQTPAPVSGSNSSNNRVASFLVPCGLSSSVSPDNSPDNIPQDAASCNLCYFGQLIQNIINFLVILSIPLSAGLFAWSGILLFTSEANPAGKARAKKIFTNVVIGLVIALSGYLIVQTVLNTLLSSGFQSGGWSWNSLQCTSNRPRYSTVGEIFQYLYNPSGTGVSVGTTPNTGNGGTTGGGRGSSTCADGNSACSVSAIQASAQQNNVTLSANEAKALSCIAVTESTGGTSGCSNQNACGTFQITGQNWNAASNHAGNCNSSVSRDNQACNLQTALIMFQKSGYQPWTGTCGKASGCGNVGYGQQWNPAASTCVNNFDPNHTAAVN